MQQAIKSTKLFVVIMLLTSLAPNSYSQTSKLSIAINSLITNFNYGKVNAELSSYKKNYQGLQAGFSYQAGITPMFSLVPEIYFAMKGGTLNTGNSVTVSKSTLKLYSVEMPVLARLHINKLYLNAGPYASYHIGGRLKTDPANSVPATSSKLSFGNDAGDFKRWDAGLQVGAGYNFSMKRSILTLDVRYGYGLVNASPDMQRYNRMLNISLQVTKLKTKNERKMLR